MLFLEWNPIKFQFSTLTICCIQNHTFTLPLKAINQQFLACAKLCKSSPSSPVSRMLSAAWSTSLSSGALEFQKGDTASLAHQSSVLTTYLYWVLSFWFPFFFFPSFFSPPLFSFGFFLSFFFFFLFFFLFFLFLFSSFLTLLLSSSSAVWPKQVTFPCRKGDIDLGVRCLYIYRYMYALSCISFYMKIASFLYTDSDEEQHVSLL